VGLYAISSVISLVNSNIKNIGWDEISLEIGALVILIYITRIKLNKDLLIKFSSTLIIIQSCVSIINFPLSEETRAAGTFLSTYSKANYFPNALGLFLVMTIPLIFYLKNKWLRLITLSLGTTTLLLTLSRGALLVFIIQIIAILIFEFLRNRKAVIYTLASLTIAIILFNSLLLIKNQDSQQKIDLKEKYTFSNTEKLTSVNERAIFMQNSINQIIKNPFSGWGPNTFSAIYPGIQTIWHANAPHPHNLILKISLERGLHTGILLICILALTITYNFKSNFDQKTFFWIIALGGGVLHNMIDYNLNFAINLSIFYIIIGVIINQKPIITTKLIPAYTIRLIFIALLIIPVIWTKNQVNLSLANKFIADKQPNNAIVYLQKSNNSNLLLANLYLETNKSNSAIETLKYELTQNPYNHLALIKLAEILNNKDSIEYYKKALELDPKNNVSYYFGYNNSLKKYNYNKFISETENAKIMIKEYLPFAINNIHYTSQNGNVGSAIEICKLYELYDKEFKVFKLDLIQAQKRFSSN
jgi:O-antigen ligase